MSPVLKHFKSLNIFFPMRDILVEFEPETLLKVHATSLHLSLPVLLCIFFFFVFAMHC